MKAFLFLMLTMMGAAAAAATPACERRTFEAASFTVCAYRPSTDKIEIAWRSPAGAPLYGLPGLKGMLADRWAGVRFAVNAGMFHLGGRPVGLFVRNGQQETPLNRRGGPGNFHMRPNGVFWVDAQGAAHVDTTEDFRKAGVKPRLATQSGPMLLIAGHLHPGIQDDGPSRLIRNGVAAAADGGALFVISDQPVSFGKFARFYRDALGARDALFLDGSVSSLAIPSQNRIDVRAPLGPMIWVE